MSEWRKIPIGELCDSISDTYSGKDAEVILMMLGSKVPIVP